MKFMNMTIQRKQKTIDRLVRENKELREQIRMYRIDAAQEKVQLLEHSYKEYRRLSGELEQLKKEYEKLLKQMHHDEIHS
ncbi:MAG: hypothetical protein NC124_18145 [Clostridium sp.]|nr:hypothetical protein [Clostridium sp.]